MPGTREATAATTHTATNDTAAADEAREAAVEAALGELGLDDKARLLAGRDMWSLPALPEIGLASLVMSDGPIGVRGVRWTSDDPSVALPSPTALAATWDPDLAHRAGVLLAQEARRKGVHVLLAPTVNLHRSPLGGRHFEAYSEDPYLTGRIGTGYVAGVQSGGVGTTVKHFVANDAETDRFTVDNLIGERALRELYLAPFEAIVENARPWGVMTAYNSVNGTTMTEHRRLVQEVLRGEWGFDGFNVSDWSAARATAAAVEGGLDVAMPGPDTVYGAALARAVRDGEVEEAKVDEAVRRVLRLAARVGALAGAEPVVTTPPEPVDGVALAREIARRSFVLVRNERAALPLKPGGTVALIGAAARDARVLGGGSATVFPDRIVSPLDGLTEAHPEGALSHAVGADPNTEPATADKGFTLTAVCRSADGTAPATSVLPDGQIHWSFADLPEGVSFDNLHSLELTGTFTPRHTGLHILGIKGKGASNSLSRHPTRTIPSRVSSVPRTPRSGGAHRRNDRPGQPHTPGRAQGPPPGRHHDHPRLPGAAARPRRTDRRSGRGGPRRRHGRRRGRHHRPRRVGGFDRADLNLPGRQADLVRAVEAANPRTVVVVDSGSPVELPWRDQVAAVLLSWFPGQEGGAALADVLTGTHEPGGRLPTTWASLTDTPVQQIVHTMRPQNARASGHRVTRHAAWLAGAAIGPPLPRTALLVWTRAGPAGRSSSRRSGYRHGRDHVIRLRQAPAYGN